MIHTYRARRRLEMQPDVWREPLELVPEAHAWHRVDSWAHTGYITEEDVAEEDFRAAVERFCPEQADRLYDLAGIGTSMLEGPHRTPRTVAPAKKRAPRSQHAELIPLKDDVEDS